MNRHLTGQQLAAWLGGAMALSYFLPLISVSGFGASLSISLFTMLDGNLIKEAPQVLLSLAIPAMGVFLLWRAAKEHRASAMLALLAGLTPWILLLLTVMSGDGSMPRGGFGEIFKVLGIGAYLLIISSVWLIIQGLWGKRS